MPSEAPQTRYFDELIKFIQSRVDLHQKNEAAAMAGDCDEEH
jgi:hypothetical protein